MWGAGQHTKQYVPGTGILVWGPDEASGPTQQCGQKGLLQCITDTTRKSHHGKLNRRKTSVPGVHPMAPILMKAPPNWPSLKCFQVALYQAVCLLPGTQLNSLVLISEWCGPHMPGQMAPHPHS